MKGAIATAANMAVRSDGYAALGAWFISSITSSAIALAFWFVRQGYRLYEPDAGIANAEFTVSALLTVMVLLGALLWSRRYGRS